ncbi:hypothetical protein F5Y09DRAFT_302767 [Xylaria sp. FL1042]|nr:hypothetical protein F5Y09DRAFT_302767 [Xylaria sp. FL1042]
MFIFVLWFFFRTIILVVRMQESFRIHPYTTRASVHRSSMSRDGQRQQFLPDMAGQISSPTLHYYVVCSDVRVGRLTRN